MMEFHRLHETKVSPTGTSRDATPVHRDQAPKRKRQWLIQTNTQPSLLPSSNSHESSRGTQRVTYLQALGVICEVATAPPDTVDAVRVLAYRQLTPQVGTFLASKTAQAESVKNSQKQQCHRASTLERTYVAYTRSLLCLRWVHSPATVNFSHDPQEICTFGVSNLRRLGMLVQTHTAAGNARPVVIGSPGYGVGVTSSWLLQCTWLRTGELGAATY